MAAIKYQAIGESDIERPLFGEENPRDRVINLVVGSITALLVTTTLVSSFVFPKEPQLNGVHIYFAICIALVCLSNIVLIYWYRQGDVDPKFRTLIFYNAFVIVLLCVCANLYYHNVH